MPAARRRRRAPFRTSPRRLESCDSSWRNHAASRRVPRAISRSAPVTCAIVFSKNGGYSSSESTRVSTPDGRASRGVDSRVAPGADHGGPIGDPRRPPRNEGLLCEAASRKRDAAYRMRVERDFPAESVVIREVSAVAAPITRDDVPAPPGVRGSRVEARSFASVRPTTSLRAYEATRAGACCALDRGCRCVRRLGCDG